MKRKILRTLLITLLVLLFIPLSYVYGCYEDAQTLMKETPIKEKVESYTSEESYVSYEDINEYFVNAVVATEDKRFFTRKGFDWIALIRAVVANTVSGERREGGSTLSQQIAKNLYFVGTTRGIHEKVEEVFIMLELEESYSKKDLFALYANMNYYGDGYYGINEASYGYYEEDVLNLSLAKCAILAGIPNAPSLLQLSSGYDRAKQRQEKVLSRMLDEKYITLNEYQEAIIEDVHPVEK
jgi:monofunctional glycosyltransferase